jgi:outer membrane lipoprotein-sorting protein
MLTLPDARTRKTLGLTLTLIFTVLTCAALGSTPDMGRILATIDRMGDFGARDFSAVMTVITEDPVKGLEKMVVRQFRRDRENKFLMLIQQPEANKGQGYLQDGDNLWFYDPQSRKFSHTSLKESFSGTDAKNSDFKKTSLADDYKVASYQQGKLGQYDVWVIDLEATNNEVTYPYMKLWVTVDNNLVLKTEDYSLTKRLMRTSLFPNYAKVGNTYIPRTMIFTDELVKGKKTQITLTEISIEPLPNSVFTKSYVERVNR